MAQRKAKIELYRDAKREYRWRMTAQNGNKLSGGGEGFCNVSGQWGNLTATARVFGYQLKKSDRPKPGERTELPGAYIVNNNHP